MTQSSPSSAQVSAKPGPLARATTASGLTTPVRVRDFELATDEPEHLGGANTAPTPIEVMLGALASCTTITIRLYADRKGMPLDEVSASAQGWWQVAGHGLGRIDMTIELGGELTAEQREQLMTIAGHCPVHKMLAPGVEINLIEG